MTHWRFAIGLCLTAVLWTGTGYSQPAPIEGQQPPAEEAQPNGEASPAEEQNDTAPPDGEAAEPPPPARPAVTGPVDPEPADEISAPDNRYPDCEFDSVEECDLAAQQSMAESTLYMMVAAFIGVVLTAVGVTLLWRTLLYTRDAAKYAKTVADAATEANSIFRNERRPWLFVDREVDCEFHDSGHHLQIKWHFRLKNFGLSPAIDVNLRSRLMVVGKHDDLWSIAAAFYDEGWDARDSTSGVVIYPDQVSDRNYRLMGQQVRRERADNDQALLMVAATYRFAHGDGFGMEAYTFGVERDGDTYKLIGHTYLRRTL